MRFEELNLDSRILRAIADRGYTETTDVQTRTLAVTLQGGDAAVQSQTGTGKTAAFLITIFHRLLQDRRNKALIIAPTRELAIQIEGEVEALGRALGLGYGAFYGGVGYDRQEALLRKGVDIVIGTPGRLLDFEEKGLLKLGEYKILIIDEADRLFDMGFLPDLKRLFKKLPAPGVRQSLLFSATLNRVSRQIAMLYMNLPEFIELTPDQVTVEAITQELYQVKSHLKLNLLLGILKAEAPKNALIFTNMRHSAARLARKLSQNGLRAQYLTGDLAQNQRMRVMDDFSDGKFPILVATDVAARGLHIDGLEMVVNYDLPQDHENYVHRIGRTGRAGQTGKAVSLACEKFSENLYPIERYIGMTIPEKKATAALFATDRSIEFESKSPSRDGRGGRDDRGNRGGQGGRGGQSGRGQSGFGRKPGHSGGGSRRPVHNAPFGPTPAPS
ncbi:MAG: DEAD/DEAH box helicase, partial [Candidatus Aminicenantales bacterium]